MSIKKICKRYGIENYTINDDGSIDVNGDVDLYRKGLTELPLTFNRVTGYFTCSNNNLTSLKGSPRWIGGNFGCSCNQLTSLEFSPDYVGGYFNCSYNDLTNLEFSPDYVGGDFYCGENDLTDLVGFPKQVGGGFNCYNNKDLNNINGYPEKISKYFRCNSTPLESIFNEVDQDFLYAFNFYKIIKEDTVNLKRLKHVMKLYEQPIDLDKIQKYYRLV